MKAPITPAYNAHEIRAIIGLGNPGKKYYSTRHNIGFRVVDALADAHGVSWTASGNLEYATIRPFEDGNTIYLVKPQTFMNNSGETLSFLIKKGIKAHEILVVHDELEKPFNSCSFKFGGSAKGHNGLKSIIQYIGQDFWRYRFGIARPENRDLVGDYVLEPFSKDEAVRVESALASVAEALLVSNRR